MNGHRITCMFWPLFVALAIQVTVLPAGTQEPEAAEGAQQEAASAAAAAPEGVAGLLPQGVPEELSRSLASVKEAAGETEEHQVWKELAAKVAADLETFYGEEPPTIAQQREALGRLDEAVEQLAAAIVDPATGAMADPLTVLHNKLKRRVEILSASLELLSGEEEGAEALDEVVEALLANLHAYELDAGQDHAKALRDARSTLRESGVPAAEKLADLIHMHYLHYNVRVTVAEELLNRLARSSRQDSGPVRDFILGSDVYGNQTTNSDVRVRLEPNREAASYVIEVNGVSRSRTRALPRSQGGDVTIYGTTVSDFVARRRVDFTGDGVRAGEPNIWVNSHNTPRDASTPLDGIPLFSSIGRSRAISEARKKRPEAERIAESRVADRVLPQFRKESDEEIAELDERYRAHVRDPLKEAGLFPDPLVPSTTGTHLFLRGRLASSNELGGHLPRIWLPTDAMAVLQMHHSALNNALDRFEIAGKTLDGDEIVALFRQKLGALLPLPEDVPEDGQLGAQDDDEGITFSETDPIRVEFEDGLITVTLRAEAFRAGGVDVSGQIIRIRYRPQVEEKVVRYVREGVIEVRPMQAPTTDLERAQALLTAGTMTGVLQTIFPAEIETKGSFVLEDAQGQSRTHSVTRMKVLDGWISVVVR